MKCDVCDAEATVFLTQIINGQMTTVNLCESCSKEKGVTNDAGFGLADAFLSSTRTPAEQPAEHACSACGFTAGQLRKIGRMGCPECYTAFQEGLDALLRGMHKGTRHVGKRPGALPASVSPPLVRPRRARPATPPPAVENEAPAEAASVPETNLQETPPPPDVPDIKKLRAELDLAVKEERYEDAGVIKQKIDALVKADAD
jgi:protein arginine kinase activator